MRISNKQWQTYKNLMSQLKGTARKKMNDYLQQHGISDMDAVIDYAYGLATKYGEGASAAAAEMYDAIAKQQGANVPSAEVAQTASYTDTAKAVTYAKGIGQNMIPGAVEVLVKQAGEDTTLKNAIRDGAEFAWIPSGDSCAFCLTVASNGWRRASKKTISGDHADHIHAHCDCMFTIRFDGKSGVEGYDPDKLREQYDNAEGSTWNEKVNSMRREQYKVNGDKIRAQKRAAYARNRKTLLAAKEKANAKIPDFMKKDYSDFEPLNITDDERSSLIKLYNYTKNKNIEYACIVENGIPGEPFTSGEYDRVKIDLSDIETEHLKLYHSHTDDSPLSRKDFYKLVNPKVDAIGNVTMNEDVFIVEIGNGYRPTEEELKEVIDRIEVEVENEIIWTDAFQNAKKSERQYMTTREVAYRIAREFKFTMRGGPLK
jgi:hypothetical protein